jgi:uncharacterized protein (DUF3084 family)
MEQLLLIIIPALITGIGTWLYNKTPKGMIEVKASVIETEIKSAGFYQNLLDDATRRLNDSILAIEHRDLKIKERDDKIDQLIDAIEHRDLKIKEREAKIDQLIEQVEIMTDELRKYKQLNGKQE